MRTARVERTTKESSVLVELNLDGTGEISVDTGVPFFDHMLSQLGKHSGFNLTVKTSGDVDVDSHHTVEDTSLAFGQALREALGDKAGIRRFGDGRGNMRQRRDHARSVACEQRSGEPGLPR